MSLHTGYDCFMPAPGTVDKMQCRVCGVDMDVRRNVDGPTSWAESMSKGKHLHDSFSCPNHEKSWHEKLIKLMQWGKGCPSEKINVMIEEEINEILKENNLKV